MAHKESFSPTLIYGTQQAIDWGFVQNRSRSNHGNEKDNTNHSTGEIEWDPEIMSSRDPVSA